MAAIATGLKLKASPARKPIPAAAKPACSTAWRNASGSTSRRPCCSAHQGLVQLLHRRQGAEHEFSVDGDRRQSQHTEFDRIIQLVKHVQFAPLETLDRPQ